MHRKQPIVVIGNQLTKRGLPLYSTVLSIIKTCGRPFLQNLSWPQLNNNFQKIMFKSQGGKFSSVFGTSKYKRNEVTPLHAGNLAPRKLLKYCLTAYRGTFCQEENPLPSPADGVSSE